MLRELHISNLAVISEASVELHPGLNCFTGATGAGKSLVIGAIEMLLGLRSAGEMLRPGVSEGRVSGRFSLKDDESTLRHVERACEVSLTGDQDAGEECGDVLIVRRLFASGRTTASVNGKPVTLSQLREAGERLVDVHGQHEHQSLLKPSRQTEMLDRHAGVASLRSAYAEAYGRLTEAKHRLQRLDREQSERLRRIDFLRFQVNDLDAASLVAGELEQSEARRRVLTHALTLQRDTASAYGELYDDESAVVDRLKTLIKTLDADAEYDDTLRPIVDTLREGMATLENAAYDLGRYADRVELDGGEIAELDERLTLLHRVLHKYGGSVDAALAYRERIAGELATLEAGESDLEGLRRSIPPLAAEVYRLGAELSDRRESAAATLSSAIMAELAVLGMGNATFTVRIVRTPDPTPSGLDAVEFVAATNPGLPEQPLRKIASGGELSRIMLAMKGVLAGGGTSDGGTSGVGVLVFDEIDSNVGGRLGSVIGAKLRALATRHQVLCITHLPQIAAHGDTHLTVRKEVRADEGVETTATSVRALSQDERLQEIAEMIGGERVTDVTLAQAAELLQAGRRQSPAIALRGRVIPAPPTPKPVRHARARRAKTG